MSNPPDSCVEINPCLVSNGGCHVNAVCTDIVGGPAGPEGRTCACNDGYVGDGTSCSDVNACVDWPCPGDFQECVDLMPPNPNTAQGRICSCQQGYEPVAASDNCQDINSCLSYPCPAGADCEDLEGAEDGPLGRSCACPVGLVYDSTSFICVEGDACALAPCMAHASCVDLPAPAPATAAGRTCTCKAGYTMHADGTQCVNIDACIAAPCGEVATCVDLPPSWGWCSGSNVAAQQVSV